MLSSGLKSALESYASLLESKGKSVKLRVVTESDNPIWRVGRPNIAIETFNYDHRSVGNLIQACDIGIVPNAYSIAINRVWSALRRKVMRGGFQPGDYNIRFKNKSNYGRALVFMQLGLPAVVDVTPSHFQLIDDRVSGCIAFNEASWLSALLYLSSAETRQMVAQNAKVRVDDLFKVEKIAGDFLKFIETVPHYS